MKTQTRKITVQNRAGLPPGRVKPQTDGEKKTKPTQIYIHQIPERELTCYLVGTTPLYINCMSEKARQQLLYPSGRKTTGDKATSLKHNPHEEFQDCIHRMPEGDETLLGFPASAPKRAMSEIAVDIPGVKKAQIGRLVKVIGDPEKNLIPIWGFPNLSMEPVRNSDMNHTPDIRTRAKVKRWVSRITVTFPIELINENSIINLLVMAGRYIGLGDGRPGKGILNFGMFKVLSISEQSKLKDILVLNRKAQEKAMEQEMPADPESARLLSWYDEQIKLRGKKVKVTNDQNN